MISDPKRTLVTKYERYLYREFGLRPPYKDIVTFLPISRNTLLETTSRDTETGLFYEIQDLARNRYIKMIILNYIRCHKEEFRMHIL